MVQRQLLQPIIEKYLFIHKKIDFDYFEKMIGDLSGDLVENVLKYFQGYFKDLSSKFSWNTTVNIKSFVVGVLIYLKNNFYLIYSKRKIADFIGVQALKFIF